jgi:hypothetical protein
MTPGGWEQALSLAWALEAVGSFSREQAISSAEDLFGLEAGSWNRYVTDRTWFIGDRRVRGREQIEAKWNQQYAAVSHVWLDEDSWHSPLWSKWLPTPKMTLAANLEYLIKLRGRGTVGKLASFMGRSKTTASKWAHWKDEGDKVRVPPTTDLPRVLEFFSLGASVDLYRVPLFLGEAQVKDELQRIRGRHFLDCLSGEHLRQAVNALGEESARQASKKLDLL